MGLKEMFRSLDTDNSGTITLEELRSGLPKLGTKISESEIRQLMEAVCSSSRPICFIFWLTIYYYPNSQVTSPIWKTENLLSSAALHSTAFSCFKKKLHIGFWCFLLNGNTVSQ